MILGLVTDVVLFVFHYFGWFDFLAEDFGVRQGLGLYNLGKRTFNVILIAQ